MPSEPSPRLSAYGLGLLASLEATRVTLSASLSAEDEARQTMMTFQTEMRNKQMEKQKVAGEKNKKEAEGFLAENKKKEGVKVTASGLQYKVIKTGTGPMPKADDTVVTRVIEYAQHRD